MGDEIRLRLADPRIDRLSMAPESSTWGTIGERPKAHRLAKGRRDRDLTSIGKRAFTHGRNVSCNIIMSSMMFLHDATGTLMVPIEK
jgi:hypothetical protein